MNLFEYITCRKSTRKYIPEALPSETLDQIEAFANSTRPLFPGIQTAFKLVGGIKGIMPIKAPHYLFCYSDESEGYLPNVGFMMQQVDLFLSSLQLGSCWLGMARPEANGKTLNGLSFVIALAFGKADGSPWRDIIEFNRKDQEEISEGYDPRIEAARLAPSASNSQPWHYVCDKSTIVVHRQKLNPIRAAIYNKMNQIDMGIGLCHLWLASEKESLGFSFAVDENPAAEPVRGYEYFGTVRSL